VLMYFLISFRVYLPNALSINRLDSNLNDIDGVVAFLSAFPTQ
jgi:hypothetical protein